MIRKNIFSISAGLLILFLSLASADNFHRINTYNFKGLDKITHFLMYFAFTSVILFEHRNTIPKMARVFIISLIPVCFGIIMEFLQSWITVTRSGSIYDFLFNLSGVLLSILVFWIVRFRNKNVFR